VVRAGTLVAVGICAVSFPGSGRAEPRLEASGFVGIDWFGDNIQLGNSWAKEQIPGTAPLVGGRLTWLALPALPGDLALGVEAELAVAPAFTGDNGNRMSYFAPVFEWHAHALLRLTRWREVAPHLVLGGGGETVASSSPFMSKETDPIAYWGLGAAVPFADGWQIRFDGRHGIMPARSGTATSTIAIEFGVAASFGLPVKRAPHVPPPPAPPAVDETDTDGDGIPDRLDACPTQPETVNGVTDDDGCPEADPDGDGIIGDADKCPDQAEDFDGFQDDDGCPELDNDGDGIDDSRDACPNQPETRNGWQDDDGCPDEVPGDVTATLATVVTFEPARARVTPAAGASLAPVLALLSDHPALHLAITGHGDLAKRRAEAVKWYLVDQGIAEDRITTAIGDASKLPLTFALAPR